MMSADLLDRLQEDKLQGMEQLIGDYQAAAGANGAADEADCDGQVPRRLTGPCG